MRAIIETRLLGCFPPALVQKLSVHRPLSELKKQGKYFIHLCAPQCSSHFVSLSHGHSVHLLRRIEKLSFSLTIKEDCLSILSLLICNAWLYKANPMTPASLFPDVREI